MAIEIAHEAAVIGLAVILPGAWLAVGRSAVSDGGRIEPVDLFFGGGVEAEVAAISDRCLLAVEWCANPEFRIFPSFEFLF